jgi:HAE1 family hydrophobic/amphiphilic exporter-1
VTQLEDEDEQVDVRVQLAPEARASARTIELAQVRSPAGALVDVGAVSSVVASTSPSQIERYNRRRQITLRSNLEGVAVGTALRQAEAAAREVMPPGTTIDFTGVSGLLGEAMLGLLLALVLGVICVYMVLAAQFESLLHPFTIMISLPFSVVGAFAALLLTGATMNAITMIGFIMLMGIVTKNAILLVDFANRLRRAGKSVTDALVEAGATRLRPILMTTSAMIFGMLPTAIGHGDGGELRAPMGIAVIGGLITSTALTLLVVPVVYTLMDGLSSVARRMASRVAHVRSRGRAPRLAEEEPAT